MLWGIVSGASAAADKQAPTVPANLAPSAITMTGFTATWSASTDNVGVTGYEVFLGGTSQGTVATTSKVFTSLMPGTTYSLTVRARDAAANWSAQSAALAVTTTADTAPPSVPTGLASSGVGVTGFTVTWTASTDNVGVTAYEVFLNGASQGTATTASKAFTGLMPGTPYTVTVRARDAAGNWSAASAHLRSQPRPMPAPRVFRRACSRVASPRHRLPSVGLRRPTTLASAGTKCSWTVTRRGFKPPRPRRSAACSPRRHTAWQCEHAMRPEIGLRSVLDCPSPRLLPRLLFIAFLRARPESQ